LYAVHVRQLAGASPVPTSWEGRAGDRFPYPDYSRSVTLCLSLLQVVEVAPDHPDLGVLGLLKCHAYFAGLP